MEALDLEHHIASLSRNVIIWAALILAGLVLLSVVLKNRTPKLQPWLFGALASTLVLPTLFLIGSTIYLNARSESGGPVHWHAEVEFWACGSELELRDPSAFLSNKVGTNTYHEHDDKHIHLEGVVVNKAVDASLGKFMRVVGGELSNDSLSVPLNEDPTTWLTQGDKRDGDQNGDLASDQLQQQFVRQSIAGPVATLETGMTCNQQPAELQSFVYSYNETDKTYAQRKLTDPANYVIREESSLGPPSDCIIIEFAEPKDRTDKLCEQYGIRDAQRCRDFGVKQSTPELCNIREVPESSGGASNG